MERQRFAVLEGELYRNEPVKRLSQVGAHSYLDLVLHSRATSSLSLTGVVVVVGGTQLLLVTNCMEKKDNVQLLK